MQIAASAASQPITIRSFDKFAQKFGPKESCECAVVLQQSAEKAEIFIFIETCSSGGPIPRSLRVLGSRKRGGWQLAGVKLLETSGLRSLENHGRNTRLIPGHPVSANTQIHTAAQHTEAQWRFCSVTWFPKAHSICSKL